MPVALFASSHMVIVIHPSLPVKTVRDLVALAKARPGDINFGSSGSGTFTHLAGELFRSATNVNWTHVPYKGAAASLTGLVSGEVQVMFPTLTTGMGSIQAKRVRPVAVSSKARAAALPDVPTLEESGVKNFEVDYFRVGVFVPAATPRNLASRLTDEITQSLGQPDVIGNLANQQATPGNLTQAQFANLVNAEFNTWGRAVKSSGAKAD